MLVAFQFLSDKSLKFRGATRNRRWTADTVSVQLLKRAPTNARGISDIVIKSVPYLYQIEIVNAGAGTTVRAVATARVKVYRCSLDTRVQLKLI